MAILSRLRPCAVPEMPHSRNSGILFIAVIGAWLAIALFAASAWFAFAGFNEVRANIAVDEHIRTTELAAMTLLCIMADAETGQRGYLLTGNPGYLASYNAARERLGASLAALDQVALAASEQTEFLALRRLIEAKMAELTRTIALARSGQRQAALNMVNTNQGQRLMEAVHHEVSAIQNIAAKRVMAQRLRNHVRTKGIVMAGLAALGALLLGGAGLALRWVRRTAAASEAARQTFASAFDLAQGMVRNPDGLITLWSHGAEQLYGFSFAEAVGCVSHELLRTEFPVPRPMIEAELRRTGSWQGELVHYRNDGAALTVASHWSLHRGKDHQVDTIIEVNNDITARRRDEQRLRLLVHELNHRVKNTLSVVQALATQSLARSDPASCGALEARLLALASAHDVLTEARWEGGELDDLAARILAPFGAGGGSCVRIAGPPLRLRPQATITLAMALNELATNATKHGALSTGAAGCVMIEWRIEDHCLHLVWSERNGPAVVPPSRRGFGSALIERSLARDLAARVSLEFLAEGVTCTIDAPLADLVAEAVSLPQIGMREGAAA